jgi:O-antigen/teichoic acid export membrane protein
MQVFSAVRVISSSLTTALNPQITKSFAEGNKEYSFKLVFQGAKLTYMLLYLVSLPIILEAPAILKVWLGIVPEYSVVFVQLVLVYGLTEAISYTMITLMLATGNIRNYQIIVGGFQLLNFPLSYVLLKLGVAPEYTFLISILVAFGCLFFRLLMLKNMVGFPVVPFLNRVLLRILIVSLISLLPPVLLVIYVEPSLLRCFGTIIISATSILLFALTVGCSANERNFILNKATTMLKSKLHKG